MPLCIIDYSYEYNTLHSVWFTHTSLNSYSVLTFFVHVYWFVILGMYLLIPSRPYHDLVHFNVGDHAGKVSPNEGINCILFSIHGNSNGDWSLSGLNLLTLELKQWGPNKKIYSRMSRWFSNENFAEMCSHGFNKKISQHLFRQWLGADQAKNLYEL